MHDPLTGLPNRALFNDRLEHALSRHARDDGYVAVMIVDLDGFKNVNDSLGHLTGDALLIAVANRFEARLRGFDTIARLGGDEFALLFDELLEVDQAGRVAQRVLDALVSPLPLPGTGGCDRGECRRLADQYDPAPKPTALWPTPTRRCTEPSERERAATGSSKRPCTRPRWSD